MRAAIATIVCVVRCKLTDVMLPVIHLCQRCIMSSDQTDLLAGSPLNVHQALLESSTCFANCNSIKAARLDTVSSHKYQLLQSKLCCNLFQYLQGSQQTCRCIAWHHRTSCMELTGRIWTITRISFSSNEYLVGIHALRCAVNTYCKHKPTDTDFQAGMTLSQSF